MHESAPCEPQRKASRCIHINCGSARGLHALLGGTKIEALCTGIRGEFMQVALARAVAHEPALVLADEPTGNLDGDTAEDVLNLLAQLTASRERVLLMATHASSSARICSRTLQIRGGSLQSLASA